MVGDGGDSPSLADSEAISRDNVAEGQAKKLIQILSGVAFFAVFAIIAKAVSLGSGNGMGDLGLEGSPYAGGSGTFADKLAQSEPMPICRM